MAGALENRAPSMWKSPGILAKQFWSWQLQDLFSERILVYLCLPSLQACSSLLLLSCPCTCAATCLPPFLSDLQLRLLIHVWFLSEKNIHPECLTHCLQSISAAPQCFSEYPSSLQRRTACSECDPQQTAGQQPPLPRTRVCHMSCSVLTVTVPLPFPRRARWTGMPCAGCQRDYFSCL